MILPMNRLTLLSTLFSTSLFFILSTPLHAQTVSTIQPLTFGTFAIRNLTDFVEITLPATGPYTENANTYIIDDPISGEYHITGATPSIPYTITIPASVTLTGPGSTYTIDNFVTAPAVLVTDGAGEATFFIGGRLQSIGGDTYNDGTYNDTFNITVNY